MWIKDTLTGRVHEYGDRHDALVISEDGRYLTYENLQNGDGSMFGDYVFTDKDGNIPNDIESIEYGRDYADIGGKMIKPSARWNNHEVACILAELFNDNCACNYSGIDEWLPKKCDFADSCCPNTVGLACWEQFLKHRGKE